MPKMKQPVALVSNVETPTGPVTVPATKPGWQTTEFWVSGATVVVMLLTAVGVISPSDSDHVNELISAIATGIAGVVAAGYALARVLLKGKLKVAQAAVLTQKQLP